MLRRSVVVLVLGFAVGCKGSSPPSSQSPSAAAPQTPATCAGDAPWLVQILGRTPTKSGLMRLELLKRNPVVGPSIAQVAARNGFADGLLDGDCCFKGVSRPIEEVYEWRGYDIPNGQSRLVVLRQASNRDPRTLGSFGAPPTYGAPVALPSGVVEYPPSRPGTPDGVGLYTFPDGTWVGVEEWMMARFRPVFSQTSASPPPPPAGPDVAWEYCFPGGENELERNTAKSATPNIPGLDTRAWLIKGDRYVWRIYGSSPDAELVYAFRSPEQAARAEAEQRTRCAASGCAGLVGARVEGPFIRYSIATSAKPPR